ncbi:MAG TPA: phosphatidylglycerol lysyltransferase domain-containing protein [Candidatus Saccharimonadales bacterium]|nr:phosphatidylglycerol lysyltransferase domain-containing protein [Candidatus Saccharimonadales bacterium]
MSSFPQFPKFTELKWEHKEEYEELVRGYPPIADIAFSSLMGWWSLKRVPKISLLNHNLVIMYTEDKGTGFCLVGTNEVDESICAIFDFLKTHRSVARLVHVPEFVVNNMRYPALYQFNAERDYDEYVIDISKFFPLEKSPIFQQRRVKSFINKFSESRISVRQIDLSETANQEVILGAAASWPSVGINNLNSHSIQAFERSIKFADKLGIYNVCLFIDDKLQGFLIFHAPSDRKYVTLEYARLSYSIPSLLDFMVFVFSEWFLAQDVTFVNVCMDFNKPVMRVAKLALKPVNFFRKYTIEPLPNRTSEDSNRKSRSLRALA